MTLGIPAGDTSGIFEHRNCGWVETGQATINSLTSQCKLGNNNTDTAARRRRESSHHNIFAVNNFLFIFAELIAWIARKPVVLRQINMEIIVSPVGGVKATRQLIHCLYTHMDLKVKALLRPSKPPIIEG